MEERINILLVDDDKYVIQALKQKLNWEGLGAGNVYAACNIRQAKELLRQLPIQVMVCDIEMPQGSGLELLEWIRGEGYEVETLFLTSYAEFSYARRAIQLQSMDYYLKPVDYFELEKGIRSAVAHARSRSEQSVCKKESEYWKRNKEGVERSFLHSVLLGEEAGHWQGLQPARLQEAGIAYQSDARFLLLYVKIYEEGGGLGSWDRMRLVLALENQARDYFPQEMFRDWKAVLIQESTLVLVLELLGEKLPYPALQSFCEEYAEQFWESFGMDAFFTVGTECGLAQCHEMYCRLKRICADHVTRESGIVFLAGYEDRKVLYELPEIHAWEALLRENNAEGFAHKVEAYLEGLKSREQLNKEALKLLRIDIMQLMYVRLRENGVQAYRLLGNDTWETLYQRAVTSVQDMMDYVRYMVQVTVRYSGLTDRPKTAIDKIKDYIDRNYDREITRKELVEIAFLNPDYISRLFRKETGRSISGYLLEKRIGLAKELLENTDVPVNVVSMQVGYSNFSYFAKMFRDSTGFSPNEYRKTKRKTKGD